MKKTKYIISGITFFLVFAFVCLGSAPLYYNWYSKLFIPSEGSSLGYCMFFTVIGFASLFGTVVSVVKITGKH